MLKKRIIMSVSNDLTHDQRVAKVCDSLVSAGCEIILLGRKRNNDAVASQVGVTKIRFALLFNKGPLFYGELNFRLFLFLLFNKCDVLHANDLDTLLPNYLISKWKNIPLVYDSHELFTEVPELLKSPVKKGIWNFIEKKIFPKLKHVMTVNHSIANIFMQKYKVDVKVLRNVPKASSILLNKEECRKALNLPLDKDILILQGAGINMDRGAEELMMAMRHLRETLLLIVGSGDVLPLLKQMVQAFELEQSVIFVPRLPYNEMMKYTTCADLGLSLDKNTSLNYQFSLPNKLFDYLRAGLPVLVSDLPELKKIVTEYAVGEIAESLQPLALTTKIKDLLKNKSLLEGYAGNAIKTANELTWEKEQAVLLEMYSKLAN